MFESDFNSRYNRNVSFTYMVGKCLIETDMKKIYNV